MYQPTLPYTYSHVRISLGWKFTFYQRIRAEAHFESKLASADIFSSAATFLAHFASWSGNGTAYAHPHSLQRNSEISPRRPSRPFYPLCAQTRSKNRGGPSRDILLVTSYNCILCIHNTSPHLHPLIRPLRARKFPTNSLFS